MPDKKLTDKEIIKALECCNHIETDCELCPLYTTKECSKIMLDSTLDLINRLQADKEYYKKNRDKYQDDVMFLSKQCDELQAENERLKNAGNNKTEELLRHNTFIKELHEKLKTAKAEAYKEFADLSVKRICEQVSAPIPSESNIVEKCNQTIYNLLKELAGDSNAILCD